IFDKCVHAGRLAVERIELDQAPRKLFFVEGDRAGYFTADNAIATAGAGQDQQSAESDIGEQVETHAIPPVIFETEHRFQSAQSGNGVGAFPRFTQIWSTINPTSLVPEFRDTAYPTSGLGTSG